MLVDTHCHIHESGYPLDIADTLARAHHSGVSKLICVGTNNVTSNEAVRFVENHENIWASIGVHPHDSKDGYEKIIELASKKNEKIIAIGEIGLDYFYTHSPRDTQIQAFEAQLQIAVDHKLPVIFHVREAFEDFWPIFDNFSGLRGVLHSFTDNADNVEKGLERGLYIGLNGISTFTKNEQQQQLFDSIPLDKLLFETDAPFLTPVPHRGKVNEPAYVRVIAAYHAERRRISLDEIAACSTENATSLFAI